ncbi:MULTISPECIES: hypothetical protein [unclassified Caballeronia]|uniref:hypothetical protein n=1 Tax=unclassified Caballeronia TaxID=2646786 RepID=UPI002864F98D|nr:MULTISPECIES: hypothetical protein [unclassified Caballeronia]MDR5750351.1 hypothetical protein [Caballeronia sp. LZ024]MDR5842617.1 hypothetical protein [Caballeronia sp. LZ031]
MLNLQPVVDVIASLHPAVQVALLLGVIWGVRNVTENTLRLHRQGYLRAIPTFVVVSVGGVAGYIVGGAIVAIATTAMTTNSLVFAASMRLHAKRMARIRAFNEQFQQFMAKK